MNTRRRNRLAMLLAVIAFCSGPSRADTWTNIVSSRVTSEYESNPALSPTDQEGVWRTLFEPAYALTGTFDEDELRTGLALQMARSSDDALSPMRNSPSAFMEWLHQIDEGEFGLTARYVEIATRDATVDATAPVPVASTRASRTGSGRWNKVLSERSSVAVDGSYERVSYEGGSFIDYTTRSGNLLFSYATSDSSTLFIKSAYADYEPTDGGPIVRISSGALGLNLEFQNDVSASVQAGKYQVRDGTESGTIGEATLRHRGERTQLSLSGGRQISPSGLGGFSTVDVVNGSWSYALSDLSTSGIDLGWRRGNFDNVVINRTSGVWLRRELNNFWGMRAYYLNHTISGEIINTASSNIVGLTLAYTHTDF